MNVGVIRMLPSKSIRLLTAAMVVSSSFSCTPAHAEDEYANGGEIARTKPTDPAVLVSLEPDKTMGASHVKVAHIQDGLPLLCFKDPDKQMVGCFYVNTKSGQVVFVQVPTDEKSI